MNIGKYINPYSWFRWISLGLFRFRMKSLYSPFRHVVHKRDAYVFENGVS